MFQATDMHTYSIACAAPSMQLRALRAWLAAQRAAACSARRRQAFPSFPRNPEKRGGKKFRDREAGANKFRRLAAGRAVIGHGTAWRMASAACDACACRGISAL